MPLTCPACGKDYEDTPAIACERCGCDLSRLLAVATAAERRLSDAARCLRDRQWRTALGHAEKSWGLRNTPEAAQLAFLAAGALGETERAFRWRLRIPGIRS